LGCIVLRKASSLVYIVLAALFIYKAIEEAHFDKIWGIIYVLVGLEYLLEGAPFAKPRHH
jgi:uncharacterized membrane protein